jgi:glycosyltransferase involved in cell wall biosynthesis
LPAVYSLAEGLLLPSLYESVGMPVMEAMACGCPTLTANRYGTLELADGAAVLVEPESIEDIAAGIVRLLEDQPLRAKLHAAGLERAQRFTWQQTAAEVMNVLESLPHARSRRSTHAAAEEMQPHAPYGEAIGQRRRSAFKLADGTQVHELSAHQ